LGLAGIELIFFVAVCMLLCFGFVTKTVLITQLWSCCCWAVFPQHWGFLPTTLLMSQVTWGCTGSWEETQLGQLTQTGQKD